jgi:cyclic beta-1,2-glucan synthetase
MAVYQRTQNGLLSNMEVTVAAEDPIEIRRIHLINNTDRQRHIRLTSYAEVVLNQHCADMRHPAYNKLFIESDYFPEFNLQVFKRRSHDKKQPVYLGHMLVMKKRRNRKEKDMAVAQETNRRKFLGRERSARNPAAMQSEEYLSGTTGATLDPILSIGKEIYLNAYDISELAFLTLAAFSKKELLNLAKKYRSWLKIESAFLKANTANLVWLQRQKMDRKDLRINLALLTALIYPNCENRADPKTLSENRLGQAELWRLGISGDYPIILFEIEKPQAVNLLLQTIQAQNYLRLRGFEADLVVLNQKPSMYKFELHDLILRGIKQIDSEQWLDKRTGIFIRNADQIKRDEQILLKAAARVNLKGSQGNLRDQITKEVPAPVKLPEFIASESSHRDIAAPLPWDANPMGDLQFFNGFGGFSPDGKEYVIHLPPGKTTPAPWVNVIGYPEFGFMITQSGSQTTWAVNSSENRLSPWSNDAVIDRSGEVLYLRDETNGDIWTPTPQPAPATQAYRVRHGAGYSIFESESHGLAQEMTVYASPQDPVKVIRLRIKNKMNENRRITATYYLEWVLGTNRSDTLPYLIPDYDPDFSTLYARNPYQPDFGKRLAFLTASRAAHGFTTDRLEFLGNCGNLTKPDALNRIGLSDNLVIGSDSCAALQLHLNLSPAGEDEIFFIMGEAENRAHLESLVEKYKETSEAAHALEQTHTYWDNFLNRIQVKTPDSACNLMINRWWLYQTISCRFYGRSAFYQSSGAVGFRDQLQDILALLNIAPDIAREHIIRAARHQFEEGDVLHWWQPPSGRGVRTRISDNLLWLPYAASLYASVTGDSNIWQVKAPFRQAPLLKPEEKERYGDFDQSQDTYSLFEHCRRALQKGSTHGSHGLPLIGRGDWNDGFNLVGNEGVGESVWLAWFLIDVLRRFSDVCEKQGYTREAKHYRDLAEDYRTSIAESAWDGGWYLRAFYDDNTPLGSRKSKECQIDSIAQSWALIAGAAEKSRSAKVMDAIWERLVRLEDNLCLLFTPPFDQDAHNPGYIMDYPPGIRENGGQYTHAAVWAAWAFAELPDSKRAWQIFNFLNPIYQTEDASRARTYRVEPYVSAADVYSNPSCMRRGGWTWYNGSAGWLFRLGVERLLGFNRAGNHLSFDPVIPPDWDGFEMQYRYKTSTYQIKVKNPEHVSHHVAVVRSDGRLLKNKTVLLKDDGRSHQVEVTLGEKRGGKR